MQVIGFLEVPVPLNVTEGTKATFYCKHSTSQDIAWRVNGSSLSVLDLPAIKTRTVTRQNSFDYVSELTIQALSEYNQTSVYCLAYINNLESPTYSSEVTMLIQGNREK